MNSDGKLRKGDIRKDGFIFREYQHRDGRIYEHWISPEAHAKSKKTRAKWAAARSEKRKQDPVALEKQRKYQRDFVKQTRKKDPIQMMLIGARIRARRRGFPINIGRSDLVLPANCPVLGIPLFTGDGCATDNSPEIDRIDNDVGYIKENVIIVSRKANRIKSNATPEELMKIATFYTNLSKEKAMNKVMELV